MKLTLEEIIEEADKRLYPEGRTLSPYVSDKAVEDFTRVVETTELKGKLREDRK